MNRPSEVDRILVSAAARQKRLSVFAPFVPPGKAKRKHKKRHSVNRERSREERQRALEAKAARMAYVERRRAVATAMRAYFAGEVDDLSSVMHLLD